MKKKYIIKKNYEIQAIISLRNSVKNNYYILFKKENNLGHFRVVVSVSRKIGKAVIRNKIKRQIKAIIYQKRHEISQKYDIVIIVRDQINTLSFQDKEKYLMELLTKANLITQ
ncbi:MAG: ribonuclease P protein component [Bacilli bacterium]|nr:ribonuclease P protein component [Bacilli bacterium]